MAWGWAPIVCVLAFGTSTALAQPSVPGVDAVDAASQAAAAGYDAQRHDALIAARREGRVTPAQALQQLKDWLAAPAGAHPLDERARRRVASDAIAMAAADGQFAEAVALARRFPPAGLNDYALGPLALAARRTHDLGLQGEAVKLWRARQPAAREPRFHEAYWRLDSGDVASAKALYGALASTPVQQTDDRVALLELRAAVARAGQDTLQALAAYTEAGALRPDRRDLRREADFLLSSAGAASSAFTDAEAAERANPGSFSPLALSTLQQEALAQQLRWAVQERDQRLGAQRVVALDRVLDGQQAALARADAAALKAPSSDADAGAWRALRVRLLSDRLLALVERGRPADAVALYEAMHAAGTELPPHALGAAARAFAQQRRSAEAVPLYEAAIAKGGADLPMPDPLYFGLVYAYQDIGRFEDAEALLQRLESSTPALLRLTPEAGRPNEQYSDVSGLRGLTQLYTDRPALAQRTFAVLTREAPLNAGYATGAALTERLREHPEAALARYEAQAADEPYDIGARTGHVEALLDAGEFGEARRRAEALDADAPDAVAVRDMQRRRRALVGARLDVDAEASSGGAAIAGREWRVDSRLSSGLIDDQWRVFYDQSLGRGNTDIGNAGWARGGLGLGWQRGRWLAEGALQHANAGPYRNSVAARVDYRAGDAWRLSASYDGDSKELPWKARVAGIGAHEAGASVGYVVNESRRFDLKWQRLDFSDGNLRNGLGLGWRERWVSGPRFQLETQLAADTGRGRAIDVPYFNPSSDTSVQLGVRAQWLNWKRDDRQFFQAVELSGGSYRQAGFGSGPLWSLRYEHRWNLGPKLTLRYGLSISSHPYDGVSERQRGVFLNLSTPLP
ncbi:poly-beta-1,6 N-acetyl-D-glucosamine export porin PgaA [Variovorax sp. OK605]|uniref:poly-beta-1,6 N-acetyl-D-glucosamine export porin PgaA n=1 Tax=Variovorax sp. OK605 TaxID=1855317 RepID=UPI0008EE6A59|nr:poly-beta-1,6 N-acetyl-D-glucosamine export porin PgaA [Variovorax sp. OK605]SFO98467.1 poly-beta-1,6 N-acetyl-D-glucosamine export porin PgaA [Variovorax sp. OK605]